MNSNKKAIFLSILVIIGIFILGVVVGEKINLNGTREVNINTAITFLVSIVALIFSMITYFSIDILLDENISLIKHVLEYQKHRAENQYQFSSIEDVRGEMMGNPVAKVVYYDYLGLDYRGKAKEMMFEELNNANTGNANTGNSDATCASLQEFSKEYFNHLKNNNLSNKKECMFLIEEAVKNFQTALEIAEDDLLWKGYIEYNLARAKIMEFMFMDEDTRKNEYDNVKTALNECVKSREKYVLCFLKKDF